MVLLLFFMSNFSILIPVLDLPAPIRYNISTLHVNVLGLASDEHQHLAKETGGHRYAIPQNRHRQPRASNPAQARRQRYKARALWSGAVEIGKVSMATLQSNALDIILFLDASLSMADKLPKFLQEFETMVRDWDNALIDYQIGVVRFRAGTGNFSAINAFQPPQTLDGVRKIINLPCQGDEQLLDAIAEGLRRIRLRPQAQPYLIIVTDEPSTGGHSPQAVIQFCREIRAKVSVMGTFDRFQREVATETDGVWVPIPDGKTSNTTTW